MALPSKYSIAHAVTVVGAGGHPVRPVDVNGVALDDPNTVFSIAHPVLETDANGVVTTDSTKVVSTPRIVTVSTGGTPVITVDSSGNALGAAFGSSGGTIGGTGTLAAPALAFPASNQVNVTIPVDWQSGDVLNVATSTAENMSSPTILTHTLTPTDITNAIAGTPISIGLVMTGVGYIVAFGSHTGVASQYLSNKVGWGDATAPVLSVATTQTPNELSQFSIPIPADKTLEYVTITGGADQSKFEVNGLAIRPVSNGTFDVDNPTDSDANNTYIVTVTGTDLFGNTSAPVTITVTPQAVSKLVTLSPGFTNQSNATDGTTYTSNTATVTGLGTGVSVAVAFTGSGMSYIKNGGSPSTAATTATNGDTFAISGSTPGGTATGTLVFGVSPHQSSYSYSIADNLVALDASNASPQLTLTGTPPLTFQSASGYSTHQNVGANTSKSGGIRQWEVTITAAGGSAQPNFGMYSGTVNFNTGTGVNSPEPGRSGQGLGLWFFLTSTTWSASYDGTSAGSGGTGFAVGDTYTIIWDSVGHSITVVRTRSGTPTTLLTKTGVTETTMTPYVGSDTFGVTGTVNFGASSFMYPLSNTPGAVAYNT